MSGKDRKANKGSVVIRKEEVIEGGHHGGAWKVAYADFVTAMMAFFLLMWLLNATTEAQRVGLADYFTPSNLFSRASSGSGQPFGGHTPYDQGNMVSDRGVQTIMPGKAQPVTPRETNGSQPPQTAQQADQNDSGPDDGRGDQDAEATGNAETEQKQTGTKAPGGGQAPAQAQTPSTQPAQFLANAAAAAAPATIQPPDAAALRAAQDRAERAAFDAAAGEIRQAVQNDPQLSGLMQQLAIDQTPQGLRIQLLDKDNQPMFATGSADPNDRTKELLHKIAVVLSKLPEAVSIAGHTDAAPYKGTGMSNWELSADRANATRRLLEDAGLQAGRVRSVTGNADRDPLLPADPLAASNRRIAIVVLRHSKALP